MCIICVEFKKGNLKLGDAVRNYGELKESLPIEHQKEVEEKLFNNFPFYPSQHGEYSFSDEFWEFTGFGD